MQTQLDAVLDGGQWTASHHTTSTLPTQKPTYLLVTRLKEPNSRSWRRGEGNSPLLQGIEHLYHVLLARSPVTTLPQFSRIQVTPHKAFLPWRMPYVLFPYLLLTPAFSQRIYIKFWYWHGILKFVAAEPLVGALEYVRRTCEIVLSVYFNIINGEHLK